MLLSLNVVIILGTKGISHPVHFVGNLSARANHPPEKTQQLILSTFSLTYITSDAKKKHPNFLSASLSISVYSTSIVGMELLPCLLSLYSESLEASAKHTSVLFVLSVSVSHVFCGLITLLWLFL